MRTNGQSQAFEKPWAHSIPVAVAGGKPFLPATTCAPRSRACAPRPQPRRGNRGERPYAKVLRRRLVSRGPSACPRKRVHELVEHERHRRVGRRLTGTHGRLRRRTRREDRLPGRTRQGRRRAGLQSRRQGPRSGMQCFLVGLRRPAAHLITRKPRSREEERRLLAPWPHPSPHSHPVVGALARRGRAGRASAQSPPGRHLGPERRSGSSAQGVGAPKRHVPPTHALQPGFRGGGLAEPSSAVGRLKAWHSKVARLASVPRRTAVFTDQTLRHRRGVPKNTTQLRVIRGIRVIKVQRFAKPRLALSCAVKEVCVEEETDLAGQPADSAHAFGYGARCARR